MNFPLSSASRLQQFTPDYLSEVFAVVEDKLAEFAADEQFSTKLGIAFSGGLSSNQVAVLQEQLLDRSWTGFPQIQVRPGAEINWANGAYAATTNTIYLSLEFLQRTTSMTDVARVLIEEIGHALDSQLNAVDSPGDEGEIFAALVFGKTLSQETLQTLRAENDTVIVNLDGAPVAIEMSNINFSTLQLNGNAAVNGSAVRLVPNQPGQAGSAFINTPYTIGASTSFSSSFRFQITGSGGDGNGADGIVFVVQNSNASPFGSGGARALGGNGGNIGYGANPELSSSRTPISPSIGIEFDTYNNPEVDPNGNHIGIDQNGNMQSIATVTELVDYNTDTSINLKSGNVLYAWVEYNGTTDMMDVYLSQQATRPSTPLLSRPIDLFNAVGSQAYFGFTSGTGGGYSNHDILAWDLNVTNPVQAPILTVTKNFVDDRIFIGNSSAQGVGLLTISVTNAANSSTAATFRLQDLIPIDKLDVTSVSWTGSGVQVTNNDADPNDNSIDMNIAGLGVGQTFTLNVRYNPQPVTGLQGAQTFFFNSYTGSVTNVPEYSGVGFNGEVVLVPNQGVRAGTTWTFSGGTVANTATVTPTVGSAITSSDNVNLSVARFTAPLNPPFDNSIATTLLDSVSIAQGSLRWGGFGSGSNASSLGQSFGISNFNLAYATTPSVDAQFNSINSAVDLITFLRNQRFGFSNFLSNNPSEVSGYTATNTNLGSVFVPFVTSQTQNQATDDRLVVRLSNNNLQSALSGLTSAQVGNRLVVVEIDYNRFQSVVLNRWDPNSFPFNRIDELRVINAPTGANLTFTAGNQSASIANLPPIQYFNSAGRFLFQQTTTTFAGDNAGDTYNFTNSVFSQWTNLVVNGSNGTDTLIGSRYNDTLNGGNGSDNLDGVAGQDTYIGGLGPDRFILRRGLNATVTDYANNDTLVLNGLQRNQVTVQTVAGAGTYILETGQSNLSQSLAFLRGFFGTPGFGT